MPSDGEARHIAKDFETFALTGMREMPGKRSGEILGATDTDTRLWRILVSHIVLARSRLDLGGMVSPGADEMSARKGPHHLTAFADLVACRVPFATDGKDQDTFERF